MDRREVAYETLCPKFQNFRVLLKLWKQVDVHTPPRIEERDRFGESSLTDVLLVIC